ncbi:hypothetical protein [Streptomyces sp. NPDC050704]|uniref:hypothetical protein n=1 Tax=Streptomyces sp. NPDC050704 TaxID=3157219 RepID=UPI003447FDC6
MYLVHARLRTRGGRDLPADAGISVLSQALPEERVEHVAVHPRAVPHPVLGLYLIADRLEVAERRAAEVCRRALLRCPQLAGWELVSAQVPLFAPHIEVTSAGSGLGGRIGPRPDPSM